MGLLSKIFGKNKVVQRVNEPEVVYVPGENEQMEWAIEKANLTLHYFINSLKKPKPDQLDFSIKVKIDDGKYIEHIWLIDPSFDDEGNLFGTIGNKPVNVTSVKENEKIGIGSELISDWLINENGRMIGGYTIRAIRDGLEPAALTKFDYSIGMFVDEGVDYFKPNFNTPEGAILYLENAFDENNLEKVISAKSFFYEAELLLKKVNNSLSGDRELIKKTEEGLKLSFIKNIHENGMPSFKNLKRAFPSREKVSENHYIITEVCWFPEGGKSVQRLNTYKTESGWRVLNPVEDLN